MNSMDDSEIVRHVISNRSNYYRILFLDRSATSEQVKAAYKKMALRCHPDKNKNNGASEAFKLVGTANTVLSDGTKRRIYDNQGAEAVQRHENGTRGRAAGAAAHHAHQHPHDFFEEFFGRAGGVHAGGARVYEADFQGNIIMMAPLLLFLFLAIILQSSLTDLTEQTGRHSQRGGGGSRDTNLHSFSLTPDPTKRHVSERITSLHGLRVKYYVDPLWSEQVARGLVDVRRMENEVLHQQLQSLARRCEAESLSYRARGKKDTPPVCSERDTFRRWVR